MMVGWLGILRREMSRIWVIKRQTIAAPLIETFLYISVFGAALGSRIDSLGGTSYINFIIPGLAMMSLAINSFSNNSSTMLQQKILRAIDDQLTAPISNRGLLAAFTLGGFIRGLIVSTLTLAASAVFIDDFKIAHPFILIASFLAIGVFFASIGVLVGVIAKDFDSVSLYQTFIIQPLIFLGGVFYSAQLLGDTFRLLVEINPVYYMINTVRYGVTGISEINVSIALPIICLAAAIVVAINYYIFSIGYRLRD